MRTPARGRSDRHRSRSPPRPRECPRAAELLKVRGLDLLPRRVARLLVRSDRGEDGEEFRVHVGVSEQPRTREEHLDVGLVGEVARRLLEDDEVEGEAIAQSPHHGKLVEEAD